MDMVTRSKEYILDGDAFQIVLSQRAEIDVDVDHAELYRTLKAINPSPYMYFLEFGDAAVVGSSPEILVKVEDGKVIVRPIAGTRPRGKTEEEDAVLEAEMKADPKEVAEHVMLVDLGRNDVGKVAKFGTCPGERLHDHGEVLPRPAHRVQRGGRPGGRKGHGRRPGSDLPRGHRLGRAQDAGHADHRRARRPPRAAFMPAVSATSRSAATWTWPSLSAPSC